MSPPDPFGLDANAGPAIESTRIAASALTRTFLLTGGLPSGAHRKTVPTYLDRPTVLRPAPGEGLRMASSRKKTGPAPSRHDWSPGRRKGSGRFLRTAAGGT